MANNNAAEDYQGYREAVDARDIDSDLEDIIGSGVVHTTADDAPISKPDDAGIGRGKSARNAAVQGAGQVASSIPKFAGLVGKSVDKSREEAGGGFKRGILESVLGIVPGSHEIFSMLDDNEDELMEVSDELQETIIDAFPKNPEFEGEFFADKLPSAAGTMGAMALSSIVGGPGLAAFEGVALGASGQYEAAIKADPENEEAALQAAGLGGLVGLTDFVPLMRALKPLERVSAGVRSRVVGALVKVSKGVGEEAAQEALQGTLENMIAQGIYDPKRGLFDGVGEQALIGGILGGGVATLGAARRPKVDAGVGGNPEAIGDPTGDPAAAAIAAGNIELTDTMSEAELAATLGDEKGGLTIEAVSAQDAFKKQGEAAQERSTFTTAATQTAAALDLITNEISALSPSQTINKALRGDPIQSTVAKIIGVESAGRSDAKNPNSTAGGLGQFINSTWLEMIKTHRPDLHSSHSRRELLQMKFNPELNYEMTVEFTKQNAKELESAGLPVDEGTLYLAHFLGFNGAKTALRSGSSTPLSRILPANVIRANPFLRGRDAGWVVRWASGKMQSSPSHANRLKSLRSRQRSLTNALAKATADPSARIKDNAAERLSATASRFATEDIGDFISQIKAETTADVDAIGDAIKAAKKKSFVADKMSKRPVGAILKGMGGVDPKGPAAQELKARGVTPRNSPGLFKKGGLQSIDNVPLDGVDHFAGMTEIDDGNGYVSEEAFFEMLVDEKDGFPLRSQEELEAIANDPGQQMSDTLEIMGIDPNGDVETIKAQLNEAQAEAQNFRDIDEANAAREVSKPADDVQDLPPLDGEGNPIENKVFINHARIKTREDVQDLIQTLADSDADHINEKRRGTVSNEQTLKESDQEFTDLSDLIGRDPGPMNAAQAVAARKALTTSGEQLMVLADKAKSPNATPADLYAFRRATQVHYAIQSEVIAARTETARALQAWAIPAGSDKMRADAIRELISQDGGSGDVRKLANAFSSLEGNPAGQNVLIREKLGSRVGKALYEAWINGLLSSPKTHMVNIMSNTMTSLWQIPERYLTAAVSHAVYGGEVKVNEATAMAFGLVQGVREGLRMAVTPNSTANDPELATQFDAFIKAENVYERSISATTLGADPASAFGYGLDLLGRAMNVPTTLLGREDYFFKAVSYRMELNALALRQAKSEGLKGDELAARIVEIKQDPPENLKAEALDVAHYNTFTNPLGELGRQAQTVVRRVPGLSFVVPFIRTPVNIMKFTLQRTPLALASSAIRADIKAGGPRGAQALARVGMGSMLMMTMSHYAMEGLMVGAGPDDPKLQKAWRDQGYLPYSFKVGDRWVQYSRLDPIGMLMGISADISEIGLDVNENDRSELVTAGIVSLYSNLASKTYLTGVIDLMGALDPNNPMGGIPQYVQKQGSSFLPYSSLVRHVAQTQDPVLRDPKISGREDMFVFWDEMINRYKSQIPGMSSDLPARRDLWGKEISRSSHLGWGYDFMSPVSSRVDNPDKYDQAIIENKVKLSNPGRSIDGVEMTPEQYSHFSQISGERARDIVEKIVNSNGFKNMPSGDGSMQQGLLENAFQAARKIAKAEIIQAYPEITQRIVQKRNKEALKLQGVN